MGVRVDSLPSLGWGLPLLGNLGLEESLILENELQASILPAPILFPSVYFACSHSVS